MHRPRRPRAGEASVRDARLAIVLCALLAGCARIAEAGESGPFVPDSDDVVLERVPARAQDAQARTRAALRERAAAQPDDLGTAVQLARAHLADARATGDVRAYGRAEAAISRWSAREDPPAEVRLLRAVLRQARHDFAGAQADLDALVRSDQANAQAWLTRAVVLAVRGAHAEAEESCAPLSTLADALTSAVCVAQVKSGAGRSAEAYALLSRALAQGRGSAAPPGWTLSVLAEAADRAGRAADAERLYTRALAVDPGDVYTRAALADLLLDAGRAAEAAELTRPHAEHDALLLRLALAEAALDAPGAADRAAQLRARFEAARVRGTPLHQREEARFALALARDPARALALAEENWGVQKEPWDARLLLEAAVAARRSEAARPVLSHLEASGAADPALVALADRVRRELTR